MESIHELLANDLVNASVPICWETHITVFNSSGGTDISGGMAGDMCSGEQKIRGNTSLLQRVLMNIINVCKFYFLNFLCYTNFGQQTDCCYNIASSSACSKSKQSGCA